MAGEVPRGTQAVNESIGEYLARQRRLRGITLDELSAATRIPRRSLERLESGAYDGDPDGFARGFVRTVASALGLDPHDTVNRMRLEPGAAHEAGGPLPVLRLLLALVVVLAALLVPVLWINLIAAPGKLEPGAGGEASGDAGIVLRRDAVRALAESVGVVPAATGGAETPAESGPPVPEGDPEARLLSAAAPE
jgi:hypothetical protein